MFNKAMKPESMGNIHLLMRFCKVRSSRLLNIIVLLTLLAYLPLHGQNAYYAC